MLRGEPADLTQPGGEKIICFMFGILYLGTGLGLLYAELLGGGGKATSAAVVPCITYHLGVCLGQHGFIKVFEGGMNPKQEQGPAMVVHGGTLLIYVLLFLGGHASSKQKQKEG